MPSKEKAPLTNERLAHKADNQFDLINYAIELAKTMIESGRECRVPTDVHNPAYEVLLEMSEGKDSLEPLETDVKRVDLIQPVGEPLVSA